MSARHIALVTPGFPADEQDSDCIPALQDYVLALRAAHPDWRISIFALHYPARRAPYQWHGLDVLPIGGDNARLPRRLLAQAQLLTALHQAGPFDLIHAFWLGECAGVARLAARLCGAPLVVTLMGQEVRHIGRWHSLLGKPGVTGVAVSAFQRRVLLENGGPNVGHVIPWGVAPVEQPACPREIDLLAVGNLIPVKDPLAFVRIVAHLVVQRPTLRACWAGWGPLLEPAEALARQLGVADNLSFTGRLPRAAVFDLMARSRVLLHTAAFESFAMVMAEARARGAMVVSRAVGIAPSSADPGFRLAVGEEGLAAAALAALADDPPPPCRLWPIEQTVEAYTQLYQGLTP
ncbi:glycosyltransferase [Niveispirillum sp. SYP-B3756]|uniref:glycosyltransferase n=1 Tax=Niveispirillum sp. SYP-B3756 TaxID=2662178 RepID=UPI001290A161|nr:glycosyltransferase [Niveispirillum sp. SYP-B3756]MQP66198.1 glycosyltransferase [Niveispirillum sp. SYP-B3756]